MKQQEAVPSPLIQPADSHVEFDLICVGFGPANLAIAIAIHDALAAGDRLCIDGSSPRILFIEKQEQFEWHAGMLLPGTRMQISFIKDLATLRNPRSEFTFLNFLHHQGRLPDFTGLGTFMPTRAEYTEYLQWCASYFVHIVHYGEEVISVSPAYCGHGPVRDFFVRSQIINSGNVQTHRGRNILLAIGGQPSIPEEFPRECTRLLHSSQYTQKIESILPNKNNHYRIAIIGAGQSAAEVFNDLHTSYPNSRTHLVMRHAFLRPSDDSPFVNTIFNPQFVDCLFPQSAQSRHHLITEASATNYGVVRSDLLKKLYELMYDQRRLLGADEQCWPHRIIGGVQVTAVEAEGACLKLKIQHVGNALTTSYVECAAEQYLDADLIIAATGYKREAHVEMLKAAWNMLPILPIKHEEFDGIVSGWTVATEHGLRKMAVDRNYKVQFKAGMVAEDSGIWLQGCCEGTHGVGNTTR